jgi:hypothetical protein
LGERHLLRRSAKTRNWTQAELKIRELERTAKIEAAGPKHHH